MNLTEKDLLKIEGGATASYSTILNSISKLINTLLDLGRNIGSALRYATSGRRC